MIHMLRNNKIDRLWADKLTIEKTQFILFVEIVIR